MTTKIDSPSREDEKLDETLEETFPASDAPANTVETGIRISIEDRSDAPVESGKKEKSRSASRKRT
jgi:hypothetical protein